MWFASEKANRHSVRLSVYSGFSGRGQTPEGLLRLDLAYTAVPQKCLETGFTAAREEGLLPGPLRPDGTGSTCHLVPGLPDDSGLLHAGALCPSGSSAVAPQAVEH